MDCQPDGDTGTIHHHFSLEGLWWDDLDQEVYIDVDFQFLLAGAKAWF